MGTPKFTLSKRDKMSIIEMDYRANEEFVIEVAKVAASMVDMNAPHAPDQFAELFDMVLKKTKRIT